MKSLSCGRLLTSLWLNVSDTPENFAKNNKIYLYNSNNVTNFAFGWMTKGNEPPTKWLLY